MVEIEHFWVNDSRDFIDCLVALIINKIERLIDRRNGQQTKRCGGYEANGFRGSLDD
jgi:hypothetical protein